MRIPRFYCPDLRLSNLPLDLPVEAHRHAVQVLRLKTGDIIRVFDGKGLEYQATLTEVAKRQSSIDNFILIDEGCESPLDITLLQGISRGERMDYALQKAVELGATRIVPVITERCNVQLSNGRAEKRLQHWQGVIVSACEQSGRNVMPELANVTQLEEVIEGDGLSCRLVLDPLAEKGFNSISKQNKVSVLIGPEGGLSEAEVKQAVAAGFQAVRFGPRILRTETATAASLAVMQTLWGDLG